MYCVEHLHRLPGEIDAPVAAVFRGMIVLQEVNRLREEEIERRTSGYGN